MRREWILLSAAADDANDVDRAPICLLQATDHCSVTAAQWRLSTDQLQRRPPPHADQS